MLTFDDNSLFQQLCGAHDTHLMMVERALDVEITPRGNRLSFVGEDSAVVSASNILSLLYQRLTEGHSLSAADIDAAIRLAEDGDAVVSEESQSINVLSLQKRSVSPRSPAQAKYLDLLGENELVFGVGPAGTGKTYLAVAWAMHLFLTKQVDRVIMSRPALEAGERIGFLPGDMKEKVDPYLRPLYDALYDMLHTDFTDRKIAGGEFEIAPLGFMRGRTLTRAAVILDEAQNATIPQMKMFLTRLGEDSRMIITGDATQSDLPPGTPSGLPDALSLLKNVKGVGMARFTASDVVRHKLVARIVKAYERRDKARTNGDASV